ncbi:MAG TPA: hypothetical protein VGR98_28000 [Streptosporangiaceae bacterium]|nr:hypothetical protein [Streptosporangiaceae bacterium]
MSEGFSHPVVRVEVIGGGTGAGVFVYNGTPQAGNPPVAWMSEATADPFGNALPAVATDIVTYNSATHELAWMSKGAVHVGLTTDFNPGSVAGVSGGLSIGSPLATGADVPGSVHLDSALSPRGNGATPQLKLFNGTVIAANGAAVPVAGGLAVSGGSTTDTLTVNGETTMTPQAIVAKPVIEQVDSTIIPVTQTVATALTKAWNVFANDAATVNTCYELKAGGFGTQAAGAAQGLTVTLALFANFGSIALPAADIPAGATFVWEFEGTVIVTGTGAGGAGRATGTFRWNQPGSAAKEYVIGQSGSVDSSVNWTGGHSYDLTAAWASAAGAPTISSLWSRFRRSQQ